MKKRVVKIVGMVLLMSGLGLCNHLVAATHHTKSATVKITKQTSIVDINSAGVSALSSLKGIGVKRAKAIIAYREAHGDFHSINDLSKVKGISKSAIEKLLKNHPGKITANPAS